MSKILVPSADNIALCAAELKKGNLVGFPTETVYGLGANALNQIAIGKIFNTKKRPKTDPLIVHVHALEKIWSLVKVSDEEKALIDILARSFWPGPLTLVLPKSAQVDSSLTAGGHSVGLRIPDNAMALNLLIEADIPIAAPSANLFGHVSPTSAEHVKADFPDDDFYILDGGSTRIGIESTVLKLLSVDELVVLRRGQVSENELLQVCQSHRKSVKISTQDARTSIDESSDAPGQLLSHYAPKVRTAICELSSLQNISSSNKNLLQKAVVIDYGSMLSDLSSLSLRHLNLSQSKIATEASQNLFSFLRQAEVVSGAEIILLPDLRDSQDQWELAIFDRMYRSASGATIKF